MPNGIEAAAAIEEGCGDNGDLDSVFVSPPPPTAPSDRKQSIHDPKKSMEMDKKEPRSALHSDGGVAVCRICHSSEKSCPFSNGEPLISPCKCRGSTGLFHRTCLERWLSTSNKDKCEICKYQYYIEREPKTLMEFLLKPGNKSIQRHIISDVICCFILTPTVVVGTYLCVDGAVRRSTDTLGNFDRLQVPILLGLAIFLVMTYLVWSVICLRYHIRIWRRWRLRNYRIRVIDAEEAKRKRRLRPQPDSDLNNNDGYRVRLVVSPGQHRTPEAGHRLHSIGSAETHYSTPWPSVHPASPIVAYDSPYVYPTNGQDLSTVFEPRPTPSVQDIPL